MNQLYALFRNTFWEAVRQPVFGLMLTVVSLLVLSVPLSGAHIYTLSVGTNMENAAARSVAEMGLSYILLAGMILAFFLAVGIISREIEEKTALTIMSKNVHRAVFVLGKFLGVSGAVTLAVASWSMLTLLTVRFGSGTAAWNSFDYPAFIGTVAAIVIALAIATWRNYFYGKSWIGSFAMAFFLSIGVFFAGLALVTPEGEFIFSAGRHTTYDWQIAIAALLTLEAIVIFCGIAVALSTRFRNATCFVFCVLLFVGGLTVDYFYANYAEGFPWLLIPWRALVPNLQAFWMSEALKYEVDIPFAYTVRCSLYAVLYLAGVLSTAAFLFDRREIK